MCAWLAVVAKHMGFDECVKAAVESLSKGFQLDSFVCTKCGATHLGSATLHVSSILATYARFVATGGSSHHL